MWLDADMHEPATGKRSGNGHHLSPDINALSIDRRFLADDPYRANDGRIEANMVGARGCPYDCSFCGAAASARTTRHHHSHPHAGKHYGRNGGPAL